jgi:hypothetical protein
VDHRLNLGPMARPLYLLAAMLSLTSPSWAAANSYVLGDSIGDGVAIASGQNNLAHIGIHIRGPKALAQIAQAPQGSTAFIFLGTNDAEGGIKNIEKSVDDIVAAAERRKLNVTWVGPHCVRKSWDTRARELDGVLAAHLAGTSVKYVSMRDSRLCSGAFHEPDGVHLTMKGYRYMWDIARKAAGPQQAEAAPTPPAPAVETTGTVDPAKTASRPSPRRDEGAGANGRLVTEFHIPESPTSPMVWTKSFN